MRKCHGHVALSPLLNSESLAAEPSLTHVYIPAPSTAFTMWVVISACRPHNPRPDIHRGQGRVQGCCLCHCALGALGNHAGRHHSPRQDSQPPHPAKTPMPPPPWALIWAWSRLKEPGGAAMAPSLTTTRLPCSLASGSVPNTSDCQCPTTRKADRTRTGFLQLLYVPLASPLRCGSWGFPALGRTRMEELAQQENTRSRVQSST